MGRMPVAAQRQPSQRESAELREAQALITALKADIETHEAVLGEALNMRNSYERRMKGVQGELAECKRELKKLQPQQLTGGNASIPKIKDLSSQTFYDHVDIFYDWGKRFHTDDISPIVVAGIKKINRKAEQPDLDLLRKLLMTNGMAAARNALLEGHEKEIATHLLKNVYTDAHFSILRLVGTISKRVAGLIEQSVKWVHNSDGSKSRQMLHPRPGCRTPAPSLFSLAGIEREEERAAKETNLLLSDHADRKGADICGKAHAIDIAILDSIKNSTRSGGMATTGDVSDPHLICITGDGAGLTARDSGVRVAHFPGLLSCSCVPDAAAAHFPRVLCDPSSVRTLSVSGMRRILFACSVVLCETAVRRPHARNCCITGSTNLMNQSSLDCVNWLFYKEACKAEDYTVLAGRLTNVLPDLRRLYNDGEAGELLTDEGTRTGIHVKLVLVADKPFIRRAPQCTPLLCIDTSNVTLGLVLSYNR